MKKLTGIEVEKFRAAKIINEEGNNFWTEYPKKRLVVSEENLYKYFGTTNESIIFAKIAENDLAGKRGRFLFSYEDIPGVIKF